MRSQRDERGSRDWRPPTGRWRPADGQAMLAALEASGQSLSAFARTAGIGLHRVNYWRMKLGSGAPPQVARAAESRFIAVSVQDEAHRQDRVERRVEVILANGRRVAFAGTWDAATIVPWLRAFEDNR